VRIGFPPPTSLNQSKDVQEEWHKIPLETVQKLYESTAARRTAAVLKVKGGPTP
jgi:hypothetical protein